MPNKFKIEVIVDLFLNSLKFCCPSPFSAFAFVFDYLLYIITKIMVSSPITSWQIDRETMETVRDFTFLDFKITADGDCSHEIKRCLFLGRKAMTNIDSILKSRDVTLPTKVHLVKAMVFSSSHVWMWELDYKESWLTKNWCF